MRVLEKCGYSREAVMKKSVFKDGELIDSMLVRAGGGLMAVVRYPIEGGCDCRAIRYRMETAPLFVHCCHCRWCQRETGTAFALNAMIEADRVTLLAGESGIGRYAIRERPRADDRALPDLPHRGLEPLFRRRYRGQLRPRRHTRQSGLPATGHPHLHVVQAALGDPASRHACGPRVLRPQATLAGREPGTTRSATRTPARVRK